MISATLILSLLVTTCLPSCWETNQANHRASLPPARIVRYLSECLGEVQQFEPLLSPLLTTRVPGTEENSLARQYIVDHLRRLGWQVELDTFSQDTVIGEVVFNNIIATRNRNSPRRLVLAAHYDTKLRPEGFIGATDSAVPCAMLLHLATTMDSLLPPPNTDPELTLQLVFFDGEEALKSWTSTDSLYGSRHLADIWASSPYTLPSSSPYCQNSEATQLDRIDGFILLDLLGAQSPTFKRYTQFNTTLYDFAAEVETALSSLGVSSPSSPVFTKADTAWMVSDDQVPFYNQGTRNILHLISSPFPRVWHTLEDNLQALDFETIKYLNKLMRIIVYSHLF